MLTKLPTIKVGNKDVIIYCKLGDKKTLDIWYKLASMMPNVSQSEKDKEFIESFKSKLNQNGKDRRKEI